MVAVVEEAIFFGLGSLRGVLCVWVMGCGLWVVGGSGSGTSGQTFWVWVEFEKRKRLKECAG